MITFKNVDYVSYKYLRMAGTIFLEAFLLHFHIEKFIGCNIILYMHHLQIKFAFSPELLL